VTESGFLGRLGVSGRVHSAGMVDWALQETMLVARGHENSDLGATAITTSCLATSSPSLFLTCKVCGLTLRDRQDQRDSGGSSAGTYES